MTTKRRNAGVSACVMAMAAIGAAVGGVGACSKKPVQKTVIEIKREYAARLVEGMEFGESGRLKASSFDDRTYILHRVTIDSDTSLASAERAEILVDVEADTLRLRLFNVVGTDAGDDAADGGGGGGIGETAEVTTEPMKLGVDAIR